MRRHDSPEDCFEPGPSILDALPIHVAVLDANGSIVSVNCAWRLFGSDNGLAWAHGGVGHNYFDVCRRSAAGGDACALPVLEGLCGVLERQRNLFELEYPCDAPGEERWFLLRAARCTVGTQIGLVVMHLDVSARRRAEVEAKARESQLRLVQDLSVDAICALDRHGRFLSASAGARALFGVDPAALVGSALLERVIPEDQQAALQAWKRLLAGQSITCFETRCSRDPAEMVHIMWTARWSTEQDIVVAVARDVTVVPSSTSEHHRAVEALRRSEERFRLIARATSDAIWEWDAFTGRMWWNDGLHKLFGIESGAQDSGVEVWQSRIHADDIDRVKSGFQRFLRSRDADFNVEYRFRRAEGTYAYVLMRGFIERSAQGAPQRAVGGLTDLSEQRRAEEAVRYVDEIQASIVRAQQAFGQPNLGVDALLRLMCERALEMTHASGAVVEVLEDTRHMVTRYAAGAPQAMVGQAVELATSFSGEAIRMGEAILCADCEQDPRVDLLLARRAGAASMIAAPLHRGHEVIGVIKVLSNRTGVFQSADVAGLQVLAESLSAVLQGLSTQQALARIDRAQRLLGLSNLAQARLETESALLDEICRLAVEVGGYQLACVVYLRGASAERIEVVSHFGAGGDALCRWLEQPHRGDDSIARALRTHDVQVVASQDEFDPPCREAAEKEGIHSAVVLPVMAQADAVLGAMCLYRAEAGQLVEDELQMLRDLAGDLAFGIRHIRGQEQRRRLEGAVLQVAAGMSATSSSDFFEQLCRRMAEALPAPVSFVARVVRHSGAPRAQTLAVVVDGELVDNFEYAFEGTPCERLLEVEEVVTSEHLEQFHSMHLMGLPQCRAYAGRALRDARGRTIGLLVVMWREPLDSVELSRQLLQIFASRAAAELERRQTEVTLREQASLLDQAKDAIVVRTLDGRVRYWNKGAERLYGWSAAEALGQPMEVLLAEDAEARDQALRQTLSTGAWVGTMQNRCKDGRVTFTEAHWTLVKDAEGNPKSILSIKTDISARLKVEEQLRQSQRLEAVGQLTGGVAHDFNNLLTVILGNAELLTDELQRQPHLRELAQMVQAAAQRGADLTHQLLAFSRKQTLRPHAARIDELVDGMMGLLRRTLPETISIRQGERASWICMIDPAQFEAAVLNLCLNARDAMARGGHIDIASIDVVVAPESNGTATDLKPGQYVCLRITDEGAGIAPENLAHVIEPFFTTKDVGKGTGLGLSMVYGFVKQSQGHLAIVSAPGEGTTVSLYFPRAMDAAAPRPGAASVTLSPGGTERILLVEDDRMVRRFAERQLQGLGYQVTAAGNGVEALEILRSDAKIDLLFTDIVMPGGLTGPELVEAARRVRPGLRALYSSGYTEDALEDFTPLRTAYLLRKPYQRAELAAAVRAALVEVRP